MDMLLEVVTVPVTDIDKSKEFYENRLGFKVDFDAQMDNSIRFVQLTPPGSSCSIHFTTDSSVMKPGALKNVMLVVDDAKAAKATLEAKGAELSDIEEFDWGKHVYFTDPDGNSWIIQESYARNKRKAKAQKQ